jgi:glycosyltransferase involved in cell wall biosynthesis
MYRLVRWADLVHVHDSLYISSWLAAALSRLTRTPLFLTQHVGIVAHSSRSVILVQRAVYATFGLMVMRSASRVAVVNSRVTELLRRSGVAGSRITLLPNGIDTGFYRPAAATEASSLRKDLGLPANDVLALFVGRFVPKKGFDRLLAAAGDNYVLVFVGGDRPQKSATDGRLIFLGKLNPERLSKIYRACDIFVLPSEAEGFPVTVQEAMASGLPIVTTDDPGYSPYALDRDSVLLIRPTVTAIKHALSQLAAEPTRREAMARYSRDFALKTFGREHHLERLRALHTAALNAPTGGHNSVAGR